MALRNAGDIVARARDALAPLKAALDERDNWEILAAADEAKQVSQMTSGTVRQTTNSRPTLSLSSGRRSGGKRGKGMFPPIPSSLRPFPTPTRRVVPFKSSYNLTFTNSITVGTFGNLFAQFSSLADATAFASTYDLYLITGVKMEWFCPIAPGSTNGLSDLIMAPEYTATAPSGLGQLYSWSGCKTKAMTSGSKFSMSFPFPRYQVNTSTTGQQSVSDWVNLSVTTSSWFFAVYGLTAGTTATTSYNAVITLYGYLANED